MFSNSREYDQQAPDDLIDEIKRGQCTLFVGSGISSEVGLPSAQALATMLAHDLGIEPSAFSEIAQTYEAQFGRNKLMQRIRLLIEQQPVGSRRVSSYDLLTEIEPLSHLIITTNWDDSIEQAFRRKGIPFVTVRHTEQAGLISRYPHVVVKLHGDFSNRLDEIVLTRDDYVHTYREMAKPGGPFTLFTLVTGASASNTWLFMGYDMVDDDFRLLYNYLQETTAVGNRTHYAAMPNASVELKNYWRSRGVIILDTSAYELLSYIAYQVRDFIDRQSELDIALNPIALPYTEFYGVAGSGKTALLRKISEQYRLGGIWLQAYVNFAEKLGMSPLDLAEELSRHTLGHGLANTQQRAKDDSAKTQKRMPETQVTEKVEHLTAENLGEAWSARHVILLFDACEQMSDPIQQWIESELIPAMEKHIMHLEAQVRLVFAGRKPTAWKSFRFKRHLQSVPLSPFDERVVGEMLDRYAMLRLREPLPRSMRQRIIQDILDITAGNPSCIKKILEDIAEHDFAIQADYVSVNRERLLKRLIYPALHGGILKDVPEELLPVLEVASVFRRLLPGFLDTLIEESCLDREYGSGLVLLGRLRKTSLVLPPRAATPMYEIDPVVRHLLALQMEIQKPERHRALNMLALGIYEHSISEQILGGKPLLRGLSDELLVAYIVEAIYHQLVQGSLDSLPSQDMRTNIRSKITEYLKALRSTGESDLPRLLEILAARLDSDRELFELADKLIPGDGYQALLEPVKDLIS